MSDSELIDKIVVTVESNKYYILNFYECAFQVLYQSEYTLIYCNPFKEFPEELIEKIKEAPTRLVILMPDPELTLPKQDGYTILASMKNWHKLRKIFFLYIGIELFDEVDEKKLTYEERLAEVSKSFFSISQAMKCKAKLEHLNENEDEN